MIQPAPHIHPCDVIMILLWLVLPPTTSIQSRGFSTRTWSFSQEAIIELQFNNAMPVIINLPSAQTTRQSTQLQVCYFITFFGILQSTFNRNRSLNLYSTMARCIIDTSIICALPIQHETLTYLHAVQTYEALVHLSFYFCKAFNSRQKVPLFNVLKSLLCSATSPFYSTSQPMILPYFSGTVTKLGDI